VARKRSPARLVIALSVAAVLAVFLLYTALAGNATPTLTPSQLAGHHNGDSVTLVGKVVGPVAGDSHAAGGLRFRMRDIQGHNPTLVNVVYTGTVPDLFAKGRDITLPGTLRRGVLVGKPGQLITKCPSKYTAKG
jgi:cytochrome c-type biogenesis protein CcmE